MVRNFLTGQLFGAFLDAVPLLGLVPAMLILEWRLALIAFALARHICDRHAIHETASGALCRVVRAEQAKAHISWRRSTACAPSNRWHWRAAPQRMGPSCGRSCQRPPRTGAYGELPANTHAPFPTLDLFRLHGCWCVHCVGTPNTINPGALVAFAMLSVRLAQPLIRLATLQRDLAEVRGASLKPRR